MIKHPPLTPSLAFFQHGSEYLPFQAVTMVKVKVRDAAFEFLNTCFPLTLCKFDSPEHTLQEHQRNVNTSLTKYTDSLFALQTEQNPKALRLWSLGEANLKWVTPFPPQSIYNCDSQSAYTLKRANTVSLTEALPI